MFGCHWTITFCFITIGRLIILFLNCSYQSQLCRWLQVIDIFGLILLGKYIVSIFIIYNYEIIEKWFGKEENINKRLQQLNIKYFDVISVNRLSVIYGIVNICYLLFNFSDFMLTTDYNLLLYLFEVCYCILIIIFELRSFVTAIDITKYETDTVTIV